MAVITHKCAECDRVTSKTEVSVEVFDSHVDRAHGELDETGETDFSPVVKENEVIYYRSLCKSCSDWLNKREETGRMW